MWKLKKKLIQRNTSDFFSETIQDSELAHPYVCWNCWTDSSLER